MHFLIAAFVAGIGARSIRGNLPGRSPRRGIETYLAVLEFECSFNRVESGVQSKVNRRSCGI